MNLFCRPLTPARQRPETTLPSCKGLKGNPSALSSPRGRGKNPGHQWWQVDSYDQLPEEAKAKLRGCEMPEDVFELLKDEGIDLTDEQLQEISGGGMGNWFSRLVNALK